MRSYPVTTMLQVWGFSIAAFYIFPFELVNRQVTLYGYLILGLFIGAFSIGAFARSLQHQLGGKAAVVAGPVAIDFKWADRLLVGIVLFNVGLLMLQIVQGNFLDLAQAWQVRSERAGDLMMGRGSESTLTFQLSFILYTVSYIVLVREILFRAVPNLVRIGALGLFPIALMSLVMGGRGPLLYAIALIPVTLLLRRRLYPKVKKTQSRHLSPRALMFAVAFGIVCLVALNYFIQVFIVRAENVGGVEAMFDLTETSWGVTFSGPAAEFMFSTLGYGNTYLLFLFVWYLVQGLVMANILFTDYSGPAHFGVYGVDLLTALARRVNGDFVDDRFYALLEMNTYGFFPSSFGSLFVDFGFFGLLVSFLWGYLASMVYHKTQVVSDPRWLMVVPFVILGILFSVINTPIGFANGLLTHFWLVIAFIAMRPLRVLIEQPREIEPVPAA